MEIVKNIWSERDKSSIRLRWFQTFGLQSPQTLIEAPYFGTFLTSQHLVLALFESKKWSNNFLSVPILDSASIPPNFLTSKVSNIWFVNHKLTQIYDPVRCLQWGYFILFRFVILNNQLRLFWTWPYFNFFETFSEKIIFFTQCKWQPTMFSVSRRASPSRAPAW